MIARSLSPEWGGHTPTRGRVPNERDPDIGPLIYGDEKVAKILGHGHASEIMIDFLGQLLVSVANSKNVVYGKNWAERIGSVWGAFYAWAKGRETGVISLSDMEEGFIRGSIFKTRDSASFDRSLETFFDALPSMRKRLEAEMEAAKYPKTTI